VRVGVSGWCAFGRNEIAPGVGGMRAASRSEGERVEGHGGRTVPPMPIEAIHDAAVGCER
jgi:hypothetical protein